MELGQRSEFPFAIYQLAEQYRVGLPIALYRMQTRWIRFYQVIRHILLGAVTCAALFMLIVIALFFYQYLIVFAGRIPDLEQRLVLSLPGIIIGLLGCGACMMIRDIIARKVPASLLVCTEGLLEIRPKEVDVTHWDEIRGTLQGPSIGKRKSYKLYRLNRKPLLLNEAFENIEGLADLLKQQISKE